MRRRVSANSLQFYRVDYGSDVSIGLPQKVHHKPTDDLRGEEAMAQPRESSRFQLLNGDQATAARWRAAAFPHPVHNRPNGPIDR